MKVLLTLIILAICSVVKATDYYISSSGNDQNSGLSVSSPWQTIAKVNSVFLSLKPGDRVLFKRGDTFYGTIKITKSGLNGSPITLGAYGTGSKPLITGFKTITEWTNEGNGIYSAILSSEAQTNMVTINGVQYAMGRWPDNSYNIFESAYANSSITDSELTSTTDWTGAEVVIRKNDWSIDRCRITDHTGNKLTYTSLGTTQNAIANHGYFIQNDIRCLSKFGEWYHDYKSGRLYMFFGEIDPKTAVVMAATKNTLIFNNGYDYIIVDDISVTGSVSHAIAYLNYSCNYCTIQNCEISFGGLDGIQLLGNYSSINNNLIYNCNQTGIQAAGDNLSITFNNLRNIGLIQGQALSGSDASGIKISNNGCLIQNNNIENVGYCGIGLSSTADIITIKNNFINNVCLTMNDGGGIYTSGEGVSRTIEANIIMNVIGNTSGTPNPAIHIARGIYLDVNSTNTSIRNNTVAHCLEAGLMIHSGRDNKLENNIAFNNRYGIYFQNSTGSNIRNNTLKNNVFVAKASSQLALKFSSVADDIPSFGIADNNYYTRPVDDNEVIHTSSPSTGSKYRTLNNWQTFTGQDLNSQKSPISVSDTSKIDFYYNATNSDKVFSLVTPMINITGNKYTNSITLKPYTSIVLFVDPDPSGQVRNDHLNPLNQAPVVSINSSAKSNSFVAPATLTIDVNASDPDGTIIKVELFNGTEKLSEITTAPYSFTLKDLPAGHYSLTAVATDNMKTSTTSSVLEFRVTVYNENREYFNLYPNPNNGCFSIDFSTLAAAENYVISVVDTAGKTVYRAFLPGDSDSNSFDLSYLNPGTYIVMIKNKLIIATQKFIKA